MLAQIKYRNTDKKRIDELYALIIEQSRHQVFFDKYKVEDTVDGRFDMIVLHVSIVMIRLQQLGEVKKSQMLFDRLFLDMDRACREMGIGDLSVPRHVKRMMLAFNGRIQSYKTLLEGDDADGLKEFLIRNVYGGEQIISDEELGAFITYIKSAYIHCLTLDTQHIMDTDNVFVDAPA